MSPLPDTSEVPEGYLELRIHPRAAFLRHAGATWRKPIHGASVLVADDGTVLSVVRTLGLQMPPAMRRYALRVDGVAFHRVVPLVGPEPIWSDLAPYRKAETARRAALAIVKEERT